MADVLNHRGPDDGGTRVDVEAGTAISSKDLVLAIAQKIGRTDLLRLGARTPPADDPPLLLPDVRRPKLELGWLPRYSIDEGLDQTISWWKDQPNARQIDGR